MFPPLLIFAKTPTGAQSEVGEAIPLRRCNMVPIIARVIGRGRFARAGLDRRRLALRVTDEGAKQAAEAWRRIAAHEARFRERLAPAELQTLLTALPVLRSDIEDGTAIDEL